MTNDALHKATKLAAAAAKAKSDARQARFMMSGGVFYCRTHDIPAQWLATGPTCWKCSDNVDGGVRHD